MNMVAVVKNWEILAVIKERILTKATNHAFAYFE